MATFAKFTPKMVKLIKDNEIELGDHADTTVSMGTDTDGSSCYEIFELGFDLCAIAAGRKIWCHEQYDILFFFIGSEEEITERLTSLTPPEQWTLSYVTDLGRSVPHWTDERLARVLEERERLPSTLRKVITCRSGLCGRSECDQCGGL